MAYSTNGLYRAAVRTANTNIVTDSAVLNTTSTAARISSYGPYYLHNHKLGLLVDAARLSYNALNPDA